MHISTEKYNSETIDAAASINSEKRILWQNIYNEVELYKAAVRLYTTPVFNWRKAAASSTDGKNFYDFARYSR